MTPRRRLALGVTAVLVAVAAGVLAAAAIFGDDGGDADAVSAGPSSTAPPPAPPDTLVEETTTTTFDLVPEATTTTAPRPTTTTTTAPPPAPAVSSSGAVLRPESSAATRKMTGDDCSTLAATGWSAECGFARLKGGARLVWLIESKALDVGPSSTARRASVLARSSSGTAGSWRVVLDAEDDDGARWKSVAVRVVDVSKDGGEEIVWGFRARSGDALAVDLVEGPEPGSVTAHVDLKRGSARVSPGQLDTWSHVSGSGSAARYQHDVIRWQNNAWRIVSRTQVSGSDVPPSQL